MKFLNPLVLKFEEYLNERRFCSHLAADTMRGYKAVFVLFLKIMPEVSDFGELHPATMVEYFKRIETRHRVVGKNTVRVGVKNSTIKTHWCKLNAFFGWLERKGYVRQNPLKDIRPPTPNYEDPKSLRDAEIHKIYAAITLRSSNTLMLRRDTMMVGLLLYCGLRKGEFISLQVRDIDMEKKEITIRAATSKSRNRRVLKMHPTLAMHIKDYFKERNARNLKTEHLIVTNRGNRGLSRDGLKHWVKNMSAKSGVRFHLHQFRHTFACKLAEADVHPFKIQMLMGHTSLAMTLKYVRSMQTEHMAEDIYKIAI